VQVWRSDAPMRSRLAERGGAGDGGAFSLVLPDSRSYDRVDPAVCCGHGNPAVCCLARHGTAGRRPCKGGRLRRPTAGLSASAPWATEKCSQAD
jgi:hypothetical protein